MCGRYCITSAPEAVRALFRYREQPNFPARYNVAPTQPVPIVRMVEGERQFALVRWGLIPPWVKDPRKFTLLINARAESVNDKPAFRYPMRRRRCLMPADGFYEWQTEGGLKRPYCVRPKDRGAIAFAGLWETWIGPNLSLIHISEPTRQAEISYAVFCLQKKKKLKKKEVINEKKILTKKNKKKNIQ